MKGLEDFLGDNMTDALEANKKLIDSGLRSFGDIETKIMKHKDSIPAEQLRDFEKAQQQIKEAKEQLNNIK